MVNGTTIEIDAPLPAPGLAVGDTYDTVAFIPIGIAETRQAEAVSAQAILGRVENDLIFLGYPDFKLTDVWNTTSGAVIGGTGRTATYASRGLGRTDWHDYRMGAGTQHAPYNREAMFADVLALITTLEPDHIFTTSPEDGTADHRTTYTVVKAALEQAHEDDPSYGAVLHRTVVWQKPFSTCLNNSGRSITRARVSPGHTPIPAPSTASGSAASPSHSPPTGTIAMCTTSRLP